MDRGNHPIKWGTYREGVLSQLPKFESLPQDGLALMQSYQAVLDNDETFTQYFSDEPLESYTVESRLRETLGIRPCSSDSEDGPSISWVNIFRHGSFEKQSNGSYYCYDQGNLVQIDESLHKSILLNRCFLPANSYLWPSPADAERESEITLAIEADVLEELDKKIKYVEKLKRLQLSLKKRRSKLQGIRDPLKRSRTPQTPRSQYPTPSESRRPIVSVETHDTRARSLSESSGVSSGSDIPFTCPGEVTQQVCYDTEDHDETVAEEHPNLIAKSNQQACDNETEVSVSGLLSTRRPEVTQHQDDKLKSNQFHGDLPAEHPLHGNEELTQPPPKKQKIEFTSSPRHIETIDLIEELPTRNEKVDTPHKPQPESSSAGKRRKGQKRARNNFTDYEKEHAPAWFKSQVDAGKHPGEIEKAYVHKFGVFHSWLTLRLWVNRLDERAAKPRPLSKLVVLKPIRSFPTSRTMPTADVPDPDYAKTSYVSPYPLFRPPQQPRGSSLAYGLNWPSQAAESTPIKSVLPNVY